MSITTETMTRLQTMVDFLRPISSIMISLGDGNWKVPGAATNSNDTIPTLKSFDVGADGKDLFAHYSADTIDALMNALDQKARVLLKGKSLTGAFLANNAAVVIRMIETSPLRPLLVNRMQQFESWGKKAAKIYLAAWNDVSRLLFDVQSTKTGAGRPPSGSAAQVDSSNIVKNLSSKDKDNIKEKFKNFNAIFEQLVATHKSLNMEREVREELAREVQRLVEPLYTRFWERYHEIDKGKGKYVKYDKNSIAVVFNSLA